MRGYLLLIVILFACLVHAAQITVGPENEEIQQIQHAIDNASIGDIIEVHSGHYKGNLHVYRPVTLLGIDTGEGLPVIDAGGSGSAIILMTNGSTIRGFNLTGSGGCGCGNSGLVVGSSNNTFIGNILFKNKYGIFIKPHNSNNSFMANDFLENDIDASDRGGNQWNGTLKAEGLQRIVEFIEGKEIKGNHYSDYDEPNEGCNDTNSDGVCDLPRRINGGLSYDSYPSIKAWN